MALRLRLHSHFLSRPKSQRVESVHQLQERGEILNTKQLRKVAQAATPGPWQVILDEHPYYLGGTHKERRIATTWIQGQLKDFMPIVNGSIGLGETKDGPVRHMVWIEAKDAAHIATFNPALIAKLLDVVEAAQKAMIVFGKENSELHACKNLASALKALEG